MLKKLIVLGFSVAALLATPALAQSPQDDSRGRAMPVSYADLDLSQPEDAATLLQRLRTAAAGPPANKTPPPKATHGLSARSRNAVMKR